ncbi:aspartate/glutamate racemase family protein [Salipiger sp.]|uniref:aspartate/glutamate racemase family protein n=1 Tax=Salipiger sp. TaxID=2078585 RepID=UPI003A974758
MTRIVYINPNATQAMTDDIVATARAVLPGAEVVGLTNSAGPPAIEGPEDGDAAIPGVLALVRGAAAGADAIVIACFDDTGLDEARAAASCPVLGIGQAAYVMAALLGLRFSVVTSVDVAVPVIRGNIERSGFAGLCASVRASGLAVLDIEAGSEAVRARLASEIALARDGDGAAAVVLGCAGMTGLRDDLAARTGVVLIDGVVASARLSVAAAGLAGGGA